MDRIAGDILRLAAELSASRRFKAMEFATPAAMEKYLEKHPKADRSRHTVKQKQDDEGEAKKPSQDKPEKKGDGKLQGDDNPFGMSEGRVSQIRDKYGAELKKIRKEAKWSVSDYKKDNFDGERKYVNEDRDDQIADYEKIEKMSPEEYLKDDEFGYGKLSKKEMKEEIALTIKDGFLEKGATSLDLAKFTRERVMRWAQEDADEMGVSTPQEYYKAVADRSNKALDYAEKQWDALPAPQKLAVVAAPKAAKLFEKAMGAKAKKEHGRVVDGWVDSSASIEGHQLHGLFESLGVVGQRSERDKGKGGRGFDETDRDCDPKCVEKNRKEGGESKEMREFAEDTYAYTQAFYREMGVTEVTLWRGTASQASGMEVGEDIDIETREASSWSTSAAVAGRFGRVIEMKVPVENIFISGASASRFDGEQEVVVLGASGMEAHVDSPDASAQTFNKDASMTAAKRKNIKMTDDDDDWLRKKPKSLREIREERKNRGRSRKSSISNRVAAWVMAREDIPEPTFDVYWSGSDGIEVEVTAGGMNVGLLVAKWRWDSDDLYATPCEKDFEKLSEKYGEHAIWYVKEAFLHRSYVGRGYGKTMYEMMMKKVAKKFKGVYFVPDDCSGRSGGGTSQPAKNVWNSLSRKYPSAGDVVFVR